MSPGHPKKSDNKFELLQVTAWAVFSNLSDYFHRDWEKWIGGPRKQ